MKMLTDDEFVELLENVRSNIIAFDDKDVYTVGDVLDLVGHRKAEIESLKSTNNRLNEDIGHILDDRANKIEKAKSEAIKEFAERLKEKVEKAWGKQFCVFPPKENSNIYQKYLRLEHFYEHIDNLVKEMTEQRKNDFKE